MLQEAAWVTGCDYLRSIRRVATCTERSICIWDNRAKGKNQVADSGDFLIIYKLTYHNNQTLVEQPYVSLLGYGKPIIN